MEKHLGLSTSSSRRKYDSLEEFTKRLNSKKKFAVEDITEIISTIDEQKSRLNDILKTVAPRKELTVMPSTDRGNITELIKQEKIRANDRMENMNKALERLKERCKSFELELKSTANNSLADKALGYNRNIRHRRYASDATIRKKVVPEELPRQSVTLLKEDRTQNKDPGINLGQEPSYKAIQARRKMEDNKRIVIRSMDMSTEMQQDAANCVQYVFELYGDAKRKFDITGKEEEVAKKIKEEFDIKHNPTWHCIVGRSYGSYVTYEMKNCVNLYKGPFSILLWKAD